MKLRILVRRAVLVLSIAALAGGLRGLGLQSHGLSAPQSIDQAVLEQVPADAQGKMYVVQLQIPSAVTWEELGNERGLSAALLEETYVCANRSRRRNYSEFKSLTLEPRTPLSVVLKPGACDDDGAGRHRR